MSENAVSIPERNKKRTRPTWLRVLLGFVAVLLCLVIFAVTLVGTVLIDLRVLTGADMLEQLVAGVIGTQMMPSEPEAATPAVPLSSGAPSTPQSFEQLLPGLILETLQEELGDELPLTEEQVEEMIAASTLPEYLSQKLEGLTDDIFNGTSETTVTREEIVQLVRDNAPLAKQYLDVEITEEDIADLEKELAEVEIFDELEQKGILKVIEESSAAEGEAFITGKGSEMSDLLELLELVGTVTSVVAFLVLAAVFIVLALLVFACNGTLPKTLSDVGITVSVAGLITLLGSVVIGKLVVEAAAEAGAPLQELLQRVFASLNGVHGGVLGFGLLLIVLAIVAMVVKTGRAARVPAPAPEEAPVE